MGGIINFTSELNGILSVFLDGLEEGLPKELFSLESGGDSFFGAFKLSVWSTVMASILDEDLP